jgi:hypothetical protein
MATTFQNILNKGKAAGLDPKKSVDWFREKALSIRAVKPGNIINKAAVVNRKGKIDEDSIGKMYTFQYDPKLKEVLPYYDMYPLIFPIEIYSDGFLGINMHYLPPVMRAKLMDALYSTINKRTKIKEGYKEVSPGKYTEVATGKFVSKAAAVEDTYDEKTQLKISYRILQGASKFGPFKPCVKRYLIDHVRSPFLYIAPDEWDVALMLPIDRFQGKRKSDVWKESLTRI